MRIVATRSFPNVLEALACPGSGCGSSMMPEGGLAVTIGMTAQLMLRALTCRDFDELTAVLCTGRDI